MEKTKYYYYLYMIRNLVNSKLYIGVHKTTNLDDGYMGSGKHLSCAVKKYGKENFEKTILRFFDSMEEMFREEAEIVNKEFIKRDDTYNIGLGGYGGGAVGEEHPMYGKHHSVESKLKMREARLGTHLSEETKQKISEFHKGNKYSVGYKPSDETRHKLSEAGKGRTHSEETKAKK